MALCLSNSSALSAICSSLLRCPVTAQLRRLALPSYSVRFLLFQFVRRLSKHTLNRGCDKSGKIRYSIRAAD